MPHSLVSIRGVFVTALESLSVYWRKASLRVFDVTDRLLYGFFEVFQSIFGFGGGCLTDSFFFFNIVCVMFYE